MKKTLASVVFVLTFSAYALFQYFGNASASFSVQNTAPSSKHTTTVGTLAYATPTPVKRTPASPTPTTTPTPTPAPLPAPKPKGQYVDGTYTGGSADAYYGSVQVQVTVSGGKIADVQFLQYPNDRGTSRAINSQAMPLLRSEAITAQNAQVNGVSGASDTSAAFRESLASALSQAKA